MFPIFAETFINLDCIKRPKWLWVVTTTKKMKELKFPTSQTEYWLFSRPHNVIQISLPDVLLSETSLHQKSWKYQVIKLLKLAKDEKKSEAILKGALTNAPVLLVPPLLHHHIINTDCNDTQLVWTEIL